MDTATARTARVPAAGKTRMPLPQRFLFCLLCGTWKKERGYALCRECYRVNGVLPPAHFAYLARRAEREAPQYSSRSHPQFLQLCRAEARRRRQREALAARDALRPLAPTPATEPRDRRDRHAAEPYDGIAPYDLGDRLDWQMHGLALPRPERSGHCEFTEEQIERWDRQVDAWARARGVCLAEAPAAEIQPWGYWMEVAGARVWTDDLQLC